MEDELGTSKLRLERAGSIAWCVIDRPEARNALDAGDVFRPEAGRAPREP